MRDAEAFLSGRKGKQGGEYEDRVRKKFEEGLKERREAAEEGREIREEDADAVQAVAKKLEERKHAAQRKEAAEEGREMREEDADAVQAVAKKLEERRATGGTSGIGGSWKPGGGGEAYSPAKGSWGVFERPRDISAAYGGGKRIGAGAPVTPEEEVRRREEDTLERLRAYRARKEEASELEGRSGGRIDEALARARAGMRRGLYEGAVLELEGVSPLCGTKSARGAAVFLELGMAYEAVGRRSEAATVYTELVKSGGGSVRQDARRLLLGMEAMEFMRAEVSEEERREMRKDFIDTSVLSNMAAYDDRSYNTAYINTGKGSR
jgi:hypothetical protein